MAIEFVLIGENKSNDSFNLRAWNCFIVKVAYRKDSIKPQGVYFSEIIFKLGLIQGVGLNRGGNVFKSTHPEVYHMLTKSERILNIL